MLTCSDLSEIVQRWALEIPDYRGYSFRFSGLRPSQSSLDVKASVAAISGGDFIQNDLELDYRKIERLLINPDGCVRFVKDRVLEAIVRLKSQIDSVPEVEEVANES